MLYHFCCLVNRGTVDVSSLPKTVTRQRRDCDLNLGPSAPESSTLTTRLPSHPLGAKILIINQLQHSGVTSHRQPRQCRRAGAQTVKGAQSDPIYVSRLLLDCVAGEGQIIVTPLLQQSIFGGLSLQEALLPQMDRATSYVSQNLVICCTVV